MKLEKQFAEVVRIIKQARYNAYRAVNIESITLNWKIGEYISQRVESKEWGKSVVEKLAIHIQKTEPDLKGYSDKNLWRMKQFFETYKAYPKLSPVVREISWSNHLIILSGAKTIEEKEFYLRLCQQERFIKSELERQIASGVFEQVMIGNQNLSPVVRELNPAISGAFKDTYILDFLQLPKTYNENDLQKALISQMKDFILELGKDFLFMGEEYRIQVGNSDFEIDLLLFHRELLCLVAFELLCCTKHKRSCW